MRAYLRAVRRTVPTPVTTTARRLFTVAEKLADLARQIAASDGFPFSRFVRACHSRHEVVVSFLALLELVRIGRAEVTQLAPFDEIHVRPGASAPHPP